jgi:hypothetical protein
MDKKFYLPIATMLAGILVWVVFLILHETGLDMHEHTLRMAAGLCLAAAGLIVFSGIRCRQVDGPRVGNVVRTGLLIIFAAITWWRAGIVIAGLPALGAVVTGILAIMGKRKPEAAADGRPVVKQ